MMTTRPTLSPASRLKALLRRLRADARRQDGYSLMELLIVLAILGLLIGLVAPQLLGRLDQSKVTAAETQVRMLRSALDTYRIDIGAYPTREQGLDALMTPPGGLSDSDRWLGPYLDADEVPLDPWGAAYLYDPNGRAVGPAIYSLGSDKAPGGDGDAADVGLLPTAT